MGAPFWLQPELCLSRRPSERTAAEQMDVEVIDGLAAVFARVDHHTIALGQPLGAGYLCRSPQQVTKQRAVVLIGFGYRGDVPARRHQHMDGSLRMYVRKGVAEV